MKEKTVLILRQILIKFCRHRIKTFTHMENIHHYRGIEEQKKIMASVWYEVFLVIREGDQVISLQHQHEPLPGVWLIPHQIGVRPNTTVLENPPPSFPQLSQSHHSIFH